MFRKEQIWFVYKDESSVYVYSLGDFTTQQGVRDTTDIMEKYRKGSIGGFARSRIDMFVACHERGIGRRCLLMKSRLPRIFIGSRICIICEGD